jgi:glycosyltransferase involved in cell wall biosynthesis
MSEPPELPPIAGESLSVLLLAHNDRAHLADILTGWAALLDGLGRQYEIIVVDDGSSDGTAEMTAFLVQGWPQAQVLCHPGARGLGAALRTGIAAARFPLLFYTTCDRHFQAADLHRLLAGIDQVHLVSGFRKYAPVPWPLRWLGRTYRAFLRALCGDSPGPLPGWLGWAGQLRYLLARLLFGVRFHDVDCAFRLMRRFIFDRIPIQSDGPFSQVEILAKANFLGCMMSDEPVSYRLERDGPGKLYAPWRQTFREMLQLIRRPDFGPAALPGAPPSR